MPVTPHYSAGPITLNPGETTFTLEFGALLVNAKVGDLVVVAGQSAVGIIDSITGDDEGELLFPWSGDAISPGDSPPPDYIIKHVGPEWFSAVTITTQQSAILTRITAGGNLWEVTEPPEVDLGYPGDFAFSVSGSSAIIYHKDPDTGWDGGTVLVGNSVSVGTDSPDNGTGEDGDIYIRTTNGQVYQKVSGSWTEFAVLTGPTGPTGPAAAPTWTFSTTTTDADPGNGNVRFNNANIQSVTQIFLDNLLTVGGTATGLVDAWDDRGESANRGALFVVNPASPGTWAWFQISGSVAVGEVGTYRKLTVTRINSNPTTGGFASDGANLAFTFIPAGVKGDTGVAGFIPGKRFVFDASATSGDPGAGRIRVDNATFADITNVLIDDLDVFGVNVEPWIEALGASDHVVRSILTIQDVGTGEDMTFAVIGAPVDETGYWSVPVEPLSGDILTDETGTTAIFSRSGADGAEGAEGPASAPMAIVYAYDDDTGDSDPGPGRIRFNDADWSIATQVYLDDQSYAGADVSAWIVSWGVGGEPSNHGIVVAIDVENPERFLVAKVTGSIVDGTGYRKITIEPIAGGATPSGDSPPAQVGLTFIPAAAVTLPDRLSTTGATVADWDDHIAPGFYFGTDAAHAPDSGEFFGQTVRNADGTEVIQTVFQNTGTEDSTPVWRRHRTGGVWGSWYRIYQSAADINDVLSFGVLATADDAAGVPFSPAGGVAATNVQAAIEEVDSEKVAKVASTDNAIARFDGTGGAVQNSGVTISDLGNAVATAFRSVGATTIADDNVAVFNLADYVSTSHRQMVLLLSNSSGGDGASGLISFNPNASEVPALVGGASANMEFSSAALTGTTGTDGKLTVSSNSGNLRIENRRGATRIIGLVFFSLSG